MTGLQLLKEVRADNKLKQVPFVMITAESKTENVVAAKEAGVYKGRKPSIKPEAIAKLREEGLGATEIAKRLGIGRASVYRVSGPPAR